MLTVHDIETKIFVFERRLKEITPPRCKAEIYEADMLREDLEKLKSMLRKSND